MHPHAPAVGTELLARDRVVEVARGDRVDRERRQAGEVAARVVGRAGLLRRALHAGREAARQAAVEHQRLEHVARDVGAPEDAVDREAPALRPHAQQRQAPGRASELRCTVTGRPRVKNGSPVRKRPRWASWTTRGGAVV